MNFDDRLRNHLTAQSHELDVTAEGSDAIRVRSRQRRQRRTGATVMASLLVVLLAGGWFMNTTDDDTANVATEGDSLDGDVAEMAATEAAAFSSTTEPIPLERLLPEAGSPLVLTSADNVDAPGGYNIFQSGRSNGLYYVLSTAPGVTWENSGDELIRNDTIYTFDGSEWTQNTTGDRFVSTIDSTSPGLLYTVSTGSPSNQALELGTSTNAGEDWSWTELDLTSVFGPDRSTWPPYAVQFATRGSETFVLVHTNGQIDWDAAIDLAMANGAPIDHSANVLNVDRQGISWIEQPELGPCDAALSSALDAAWDDEPEGPEFDFERELTESEQAELDAYWAAQEERGRSIYTGALQSVARVPGCENFVKCLTDYRELSEANDQEIQRFFDANSTEDGGLTDADAATLDAMYATFAGETQAWAASSGCEAEVPYLVGGGEEAMPDTSTYTSWESLGVTVPESWNGVNAGFLVDGDQTTNLGSLFDGASGYLAEVAVDDGDWSVTFDSTLYSEGTSPSSVFTVWTSATGVEWSETTTDSFIFHRPTALPDGTSFAVDWRDASTQVVRVTPDGQAGSLTLDDLAPDLETDGYSIMNTKAGEYGVVVWAVRWSDGDGPSYDSIVLYSPDGIGWGATAVPDVEVVDVIVGADEVVMFLNDPGREEGAAQPILVGRA